MVSHLFWLLAAMSTFTILSSATLAAPMLPAEEQHELSRTTEFAIDNDKGKAAVAFSNLGKRLYRRGAKVGLNTDSALRLQQRHSDMISPSNIHKRWELPGEELSWHGNDVGIKLERRESEHVKSVD
ncbi:hypothetical protein IE81DRAFT_331416 [Ceraceosorus guamensis]|uniref:Uncharacterized protein n=1 Tax=Ceraceosorus guamensis TaxID=1522189 RepID=A0A316VV04_9BASI|nr:hypothetical protein IE81DRAFT_331416 [Ceraceosorus guamensis]PWN40738.1 hypothetical protein IE81DRAFT_331416 [Ceraceosorus guamensis]